MQASQSKVTELERMWKLETSELQQSLARQDADLTAVRAEHSAVVEQVSLHPRLSLSPALPTCATMDVLAV